jgi:hypothetical protein
MIFLGRWFYFMNQVCSDVQTNLLRAMFSQM